MKLQKERERGNWVVLNKAASTEKDGCKNKLTILNKKKSSNTISLTELRLHRV